MKDAIQPHGGVLIQRELQASDCPEALKKAGGLKKLLLRDREISDLEMIGTGAMSPLSGFMGERDFQSVLGQKRLASGLPWTIPVVKDIDAAQRSSIRMGEEIALVDSNDRVLGLVKVEEIYPHDKKKHATLTYGTEEVTHPGVASVSQMADFLVAGPISLIQRPLHTQFLQYRLDPQQTRQAFQKRGWRRIAAFQTRNPIHRAHEYIQKCALEIVDGLLLHPLVGETKGDDVPAEIRVRSYEVILEKYYPKQRVLMSVFPAAMRYAGPREAIFHAILRKNYGCTHFIVGRDHAGVSRPDGTPFYGTFDAHKIFDEFGAEELGITPLFFDYTFYCKSCGGMASTKTCPHDSSHHVSLSGSKVREMLARGELPPVEFSRPEVAKILIEGMQKSPTHQV